MIQNFRAKNWKSLIDFFEGDFNSYEKIAGSLIQFRGQSDCSWKITSSLSRIVQGDDLSENKAKFYEIQAQMEFRSKFHILDQRLSYGENADRFTMSIDMQHYSCPTRLVDWTSSPYVALYFAVSENFTQDAAVYSWDYRYYDKRMKDMYSDYSQITGAKIINHEGYDVVLPIFAVKKNERLARQQGCFSVSNNLIKPHCELIDEVFEDKEPSGLVKIQIPKELKLEILARLKVMNISAESIFPGLDGLGKSIKEELLLRKWIKK